MVRSPFIYLTLCSLKNRIRRRLRRLREPKYAVGAAVGSVYLYVAFIGRFWSRPRRRPRAAVAADIPAVLLAPLQIAAIFIVWLIVLARWIVPVSRQPLQLSPPERDFLLTAPIPGRRIARYKLLRSFVGIFFSTLLVLVFTRPGVASPWSFLLGMFLLFTTLRLHLLGIALTRASLVRRGQRRNRAAMGSFVLVIAATAAALGVAVPALLELQHTQDLKAAFALARRGLSHPVVAFALLPFVLLVRPVFAEWPLAFVLAAVPVAAIALANYEWVLGAAANLEQETGAIEHEVAEGRRARVRPVYRRSPFTLPVRGRPEWAVVWKNLVLLGRYATPVMLMRVALPAVTLAVVLGVSHRTAPTAVFVPVSIMLCCGLTLLGPYSVRNDLRQDLARLSVLKSWPVSGRQLCWGEILAPTLVVSLLVWLLILIAGSLSLAVPAADFPWRDRVALGLCAMVVFPALILAQVTIQNAAAVIFPGWMAIGPSRPRGVEAMGQQMLMIAGTALLLVVGLLPGALIGGLVLLFGYPLVGWLAAVPASVVLAGLLVAEIVVSVHALGSVLERTEPGDVERA